MLRTPLSPQPSAGASAARVSMLSDPEGASRRRATLEVPRPGNTTAPTPQPHARADRFASGLCVWRRNLLPSVTTRTAQPVHFARRSNRASGLPRRHKALTSRRRSAGPRAFDGPLAHFAEYPPHLTPVEGQRNQSAKGWL